MHETPETGAPPERAPVFLVTATCESGHQQTVRFEGQPRQWVEGWAGIMDGTSPMYQVRPGRDSVIGKCARCGTPYRCTVREEGRADV